MFESSLSTRRYVPLFRCWPLEGLRSVLPGEGVVLVAHIGDLTASPVALFTVFLYDKKMDGRPGTNKYETHQIPIRAFSSSRNERSRNATTVIQTTKQLGNPKDAQIGHKVLNLDLVIDHRYGTLTTMIYRETMMMPIDVHWSPEATAIACYCSLRVFHLFLYVYLRVFH